MPGIVRDDLSIYDGMHQNTEAAFRGLPDGWAGEKGDGGKEVRKPKRLTRRVDVVANGAERTSPEFPVSENADELTHKHTKTHTSLYRDAFVSFTHYTR